MGTELTALGGREEKGILKCSIHHLRGVCHMTPFFQSVLTSHRLITKPPFQFSVTGDQEQGVL